jgi:hypothetical protein
MTNLAPALRGLAFACLFSTLTTAQAADNSTLAPALEPLRPFIDKTYKGTFKNSTPEKPIQDVQRWERALNGQAIRVLHSVNEGAYGGESLILWDETQKLLVYFYFTTAGFRTTGTITPKDNKLTSLEKVVGSSSGITEVRGVTELLPDGSMHVVTEHLKDGQWTPGREVTYRPDPTAKVIFK